MDLGQISIQMENIREDIIYINQPASGARISEALAELLQLEAKVNALRSKKALCRKQRLDAECKN